MARVATEEAEELVAAEEADRAMDDSFQFVEMVDAFADWVAI
jgi:hypothetical protein